MDPFFKWVGGKRRMVSQYKKLGLIPPEAASSVVEPFCGAAALSLALEPRGAFLNDTAPSVYQFFHNAIHTPQDLHAETSSLKDKYKNIPIKDMYSIIVKEYNYLLSNLYKEGNVSHSNSIRMTSYFLFLTKHCFNGLYRLNSNGLFNVPYNKRRLNKDWIPGINKLNRLSSIVIDIQNKDYTEYLSQFNYKDPSNIFTYIDPPYYGTHNNYTRIRFTKKDHYNLKDIVNTYCKGKVAISNINHPDILVLEYIPY